MRKFGMNNSFASLAKQSLLAIFLSIALAACGGDSGTSPNSEEKDSSSSVQKDESSSSVKKQSSSSVTKTSSSSSSNKKEVSSSSSQKIASSSSVKTVSSSSVILSSSSKQSSSSSKEIATSSSSSRNDVSSSSEYVSYYFIKIIGEDYLGKKDSVTIMAENLNIGKMVLGTEDQKDDKVIERYCYNNDTTKCDEFGGLYQWAEMMQLPSRCNTESCADLIEENHRGICPEGWRLMTDLDFYIAWHAETNSYGIRGTRSSYGFAGNNYSGLSLTGAGLRTKKGDFEYLRDVAYWFYPQEHEYDYATFARLGFVSTTDYTSSSDEGDVKIYGYSVRCVKLE